MTHVMGDPHDHRRARRNTIGIIAVTILLTLGASWLVSERTQEETNRADNALVALQQACDQVERLGGRCVTPPSQVTDAPRSAIAGEAGPPGRAPTQAEIAAAVAAYLAEHPPAAGPRGEPGAPASGCPLLGYHFEVLTVRLVGADTKSRQILACVPD